MTTQSLPVVSLFSGAGGLDLGLSLAGDGRFQFRCYVELASDSRETLRKSHPGASSDTAIYSDIRDVTPKTLMMETGLKRGETFLIAGGPPCQAFSTAGLRRSVHESRGEVVAHYLQMIRQLQPRFFVFENVRGLLSVAIRHRNYRDRIQAELFGLEPDDPDERLGSVFQGMILPKFKSLGYEVVYGLLNSADYGSAQVRRRLFILGSREKEFGAGRYVRETGESMTPLGLVPPTHHRFSPYPPLSPWRTLRDTISDLTDGDPPLESTFTYSEARKAVWRLIPPGANWYYIRDHSGEFPQGFLHQIMGGALTSGGGKMGYWRRLHWDKPAPTLPTQPQHLATGLCHPDHERPLSVREYARIQDFPDDYEFFGNKASVYEQIGNAVPVRLATALGTALLAIAGESPPRAGGGDRKRSMLR